MKQLVNRKLVIFSMLIGMLVMATAVAHAITIMVDGVQEAVWTAGITGQTPGEITDGQEGDISPIANIETLRYTNDQDYYYFLIETYGSPTGWSTANDNRADICLNTDGLTGTGFSYSNCDGLSEGTVMEGIDRVIRIKPLGGNFLQYTVYDDAFTNVVIIGNTFSNDIAFIGTNITELRVSLESLGLDSAGTCNTSMLMGFYFDGGTGEPDDNVPDDGQTTIYCGSPTAVNLQTFSADSTSTMPMFGIAVVAMLALVSAGIFIARREQKEA